MDKKTLLASFTIVFMAAVSNANNLDDWNPPSLGPIVTWTAPACGKEVLVLQPFLFFNNKAGDFDNDGRYADLTEGESQFQMQQALFIQYGILDKLEIDSWVQAQESWIKDSGQNGQGNGMNDSYLWLRYQLLDDKGWVPCLTGFFQLRLPTGKYQNADSTRLGADITGTGSFDPGFGINLSKKFKQFMIHADVIPGFPLETKVDGKKTQYGMYFNFDLGAEYFIPYGLNLMAETNGYWQAASKIQGNEAAETNNNYLSMCAGFGWSNDKVQTLLAYQRSIIGQNTVVNNGVVFSLVYSFSFGKKEGD
jgi:hypothetical protein